MLGNNASLISIETESELVHISELLASGSNKMASYWTAGKFEDQGREKFSWVRGELLDDWIWQENEPSNKGNGVRVAMKKNGNGEWNASSLSEEETHGFICEISPGSSGEAIPCYSTNDLIIAMDSSGSVGQANFDEAKNDFVLKVTTAWLGWERTRLSFFIYSDDVHKIFRLIDSMNELEAEPKIRNTAYIGGGTNSHLALQGAYTDFDMFNRNVTTNLVFLTDGQSNSPDLTREQAANLHRANVRVFAIGIGSGVNENELKDIASREDYVFYTDKFSELKNLLNPISQMVCGD